ncbi:SPL family radical SAM protein [Alicyclobacillus ferrooxydans]|uniref:SPL family radical SAM protein n=1 Tax=Alicyclobacillus ferrooxydans TaxID=471514 RepID=UPI0006D58A77|nr:radical SAM protein [Alicyclobacillus ferrooxydans]
MPVKSMQPPTFETIRSKQVMNKVSAPTMPFQWSLNPYRGCSHGCSFCYARTTHAYMGMAADDTFRQHVFVKEDAPALLEAQLSHKLHKLHGDYQQLQQEIGLLAIGTATDPYQPIEARQQITRGCLEVLAAFGIQTSITTRSPLILNDLDILLKMNLHSVNISIHTLDKMVWRNLEPATPAPAKRLETVHALAEEGLNAGVFVAPIIPLLTDSALALAEVIHGAREHKANFVMPSVLRLTPEVKMWFLNVLKEHYPDLLPQYARLYKTAYPPKSYVQPLMDTVKLLMQEAGLNSYSQVCQTTEMSGTTVEQTSTVSRPANPYIADSVLNRGQRQDDRGRYEQMVLPI